jgi:biotin transport system substrate-specific component
MNEQLEHTIDSTAAPQGRIVRPARRTAAIGLGALLVAIAAQVIVPVPFSPVPMTLQPLAVLVVGGLLGPVAGAAALGAYLAAGLLGLPVFAGGGSGLLRLLGPTGGYLLAFPFAAAVTGWTAGRLSADGAGILRALAACALGMVVIHAGGVSQLALLGGDPALAFRVGFVPFFTGDLLKIGLAAAVMLLVGPRLRALL